MKQEATVTARTGISKLNVKLDQPMGNRRYHISMSIIEPKRDELKEQVTMQVLEGKDEEGFTIAFGSKTIEKLTISYIVED